jgi:hypothetical protein
VRHEDGSWLLDGLMLRDNANDLLGLTGRAPNGDAFGSVETWRLAMSMLGRVQSLREWLGGEGRRVAVIDIYARRVDKLVADQRR